MKSIALPIAIGSLERPAFGREGRDTPLLSLHCLTTIVVRFLMRTRLVGWSVRARTTVM